MGDHMHTPIYKGFINYGNHKLNVNIIAKPL